ERRAPLLISHPGQFPANTVSFNLAPGAAPGQAVEAIDRVKAEQSGSAAPPAARAPDRTAATLS
ncbi:hypothetical protein OMR07_08820, partial [Methylobacterium organophilum]|nr:hypothetical protein [Methylobacterium organophilum]